MWPSKSLTSTTPLQRICSVRIQRIGAVATLRGGSSFPLSPHPWSVRLVAYFSKTCISSPLSYSSFPLDFVKYITSVPSITSIIAILGLLIFYIYGTLNASPRQFRLTGTIVEIAILATIFIWNAFIHRRDLQLRGREVKDRVRGVILELETIRVQPGQVTTTSHFVTYLSLVFKRIDN